MLKKSVSFLLLLILVFSLSVHSFASEIGAQTTDEIIRLISDVSEFISQNYKFNISKEELKDAAMRHLLDGGNKDADSILHAMFSELDDYSVYMEKESYESFAQQISASSSGIGVSVVKTKKGLCISSVVPGSSAEKAGLLPFDTIVSIDGSDITELDIDAALLLIPKNLAAPVTLGILKDGKSEVMYVTLVRANLIDNPVSWYIIDDETAYIKIDILSVNCDMYVKQALTNIDKAGIKKIILDLRDNPGGELYSTVRICGMFMPKGVVGYVEPKDEEKLETYYSENENPKYRLAVLINGGTASGAEFLSGGLQDTGVGRLFGEKSFGKGTVQNTIELKSGGAFKLTVAKYYTAKLQDVDKYHINPDEQVSNAYQLINENGFESLDFDTPTNVGSTGLHVLAIEQRLSALSYFTDVPDEVFDEETLFAIRQFKLSQGWEPTPVVDFYLLARLSDIEYSKMYVVIDRQLQAAHNYLKELTVK